MTYLRRCYSLLLFVLFLSASCLLFSCSVTKKQRIKIVTEFKVDTILLIKTDTVPIIKAVLLHDTAKIETKFAKAESFVNPVSGKLTLKLTGKNFFQPVKMNVKEIIKTVTKETKNKFPVWIFLIIQILIIIIYKYYERK